MLSVVVVVVVGSKENCFFKISAYVQLVAVYVGLSSLQGNACKGGGSVSGGMDLQTMGSKFASTQAQAAGKFGFVVTMIVLLHVAGSSWRNQGCQRRWL